MSTTKKTEPRDLRNVKVKTLRPHTNSHGKKFEKGKGDVYTHPRPEGDIKAGVVELAENDAPATTGQTSKG